MNASAKATKATKADKPARSSRARRPDPLAGLPKALRAEVERLGSADIMVGIPSFRNAATIGHVVRAAHAGLVQYFPDLRPVLVNADAGSLDGTQRVVVETESPDYIASILLVRPRNRLRRISLTYPEVDGVGGKGAALRTLFQIARALEVQALVVVDSDLRSIGPEWIELLAGPILKGGFDYTTPLYSRHKFDGTITNTVTYPLTRSLYGLRIRQPIGGDFGVSGDLIDHYLNQDDWTSDVSKFGIDIWMTTTAVAGGYAICQARLGAKIHDPKDPGADLGPMFSQVVGTALRLTERHSDRWLRVTGSRDVPAYGFERIVDPLPLDVNVGRLLSSFAAGAHEHAAAWAEIGVLAGPDRLQALATEAGDVAASGAAAGFSFADETWARVVYGSLLAYHRRRLEVDELIPALVPLYFGRVASHVIETGPLDDEGAEAVVDRQARAYEALKPELVAAWRDQAAR
ncbi:MAG: glycosyl transferase family 2 [Candidatus Limnocylindrales bacterium]|jgi:glycosyltransferase involved in cell wall biosynthesis